MGEFVPFFAIGAVFGVGAFAIWTEHLRKLAQIQADGADARSARANQDLEDRVRVLERIVTDRGYDLASQIEALRDERRLDAQDGASRAREVL